MNEPWTEERKQKCLTFLREARDLSNDVISKYKDQMKEEIKDSMTRDSGLWKMGRIIAIQKTLQDEIVDIPINKVKT